MKQILILVLKIYRNVFSANMLRCCIFYPSCSQYAIESIEKRGIVRGLYFSVLRVLRCNPFSYGGFDPVNPVRELSSFTPPENSFLMGPALSCNDRRLKSAAFSNPERIDPDEFEEFLRTSPGQSFQIDQGQPHTFKDGSNGVKE